MDLFLRPTVLAGDKLENDFGVIHEGRMAGRIRFAQFHVNANAQNRHRLHQALLDALSPDTPPTENHRLLAQLPLTTVWTTNYDRLIETSRRRVQRGD